MTVFLMTIRETLPPTEKTPLISKCFVYFLYKKGWDKKNRMLMTNFILFLHCILMGHVSQDKNIINHLSFSGRYCWSDKTWRPCPSKTSLPTSGLIFPNLLFIFNLIWMQGKIFTDFHLNEPTFVRLINYWLLRSLVVIHRNCPVNIERCLFVVLNQFWRLRRRFPFRGFIMALLNSCSSNISIQGNIDWYTILT